MNLFKNTHIILDNEFYFISFGYVHKTGTNEIQEIETMRSLYCCIIGQFIIYVGKNMQNISNNLAVKIRRPGSNFQL